VEDNQTFLEHRIEKLKEEIKNINIISSEDGIKCNDGRKIDEILQQPLDMAVLDYELSDSRETGISTVKKIRKSNKYCKLIFYTGLMDEIKKEELLELMDYNIYRFIDRNELKEILTKEIETGFDIISIIDRWLFYYDKDDFTFTELGDKFKDKRLSEIAREVRLQTSIGQEFVTELTKTIFNLLVD
jgi:DNA-binding NarL/FixJ family response regulator